MIILIIKIIKEFIIKIINKNIKIKLQELIFNLKIYEKD